MAIQGLKGMGNLLGFGLSLLSVLSSQRTSRMLLSFCSGELPSLPPPGRMLSKSMLKAVGRLETAHVTPLSLSPSEWNLWTLFLFCRCPRESKTVNVSLFPWVVCLSMRTSWYQLLQIAESRPFYVLQGSPPAPRVLRSSSLLGGGRFGRAGWNI